MKTQILSAKPLIEKSQVELSERVSQIKMKRGHPPKLVVVLIGDDPASVIYTNNKGRSALAIGMDHETVNFPATATPAEVHSKIIKLNEDPKVDGILIQRPLPKLFNEEEVIYWITPKKDVDCFHPENLGRLWLGMDGFKSCTPLGVIRLLDHYGISIKGKTACVIGRSSIVGKPMTALLLNGDATPIECHSKTNDLRHFTLQSDLVVVAAGKPHLIDQSYIKKGSIVIDVGIHKNSEGKIIGDVNAESLMGHASALTPVPGGVGLTTINSLLMNTVFAAENFPK